MTISARRLFSWKFAFYDLMLPALRTLGPARADRVLAALGLAAAWAWPGRRKRLARALGRISEALGTDGPSPSAWPEFAAGTVRFLARDYLLDVADDACALGRFEVSGDDRLREAVASGRGAILVGGHFGAHLAGVHWLLRSGLPVSAMVQRPPHISGVLSRLFDARLAQGPEHDLFLRRKSPRVAAVELLLRARAVLRKGQVVYACGDIPWQGRNCRPGRLLDHEDTFLAIWADLAALTRVPVFHAFCDYLPGGRYRLEIAAADQVRPGEEDQAVADFLMRLEARVARDPAQAVAHLLWPCYQPPGPAATNPGRHEPRMHRPSRRSAPIKGTPSEP